MNIVPHRLRFLTLALIATFLMIVAPHTALAAPPEGYNFLPLDKASQQAGIEKKPMLLYFGRYGCSTCRKMHKEVFSDDGIRKSYSDQFVLAYVDTESGNRIRLPNGERTTEMQFAARSRILGTPTFIYFSQEQKPLFKRSGFQSIEKMDRFSQFVNEGHYKTTPLKDFMAKQ